jgi:hypothetical protein
MDPLTALSLAGNIIQFVEFGCRLLSTGKKLYRSSAGSLTVNNEIELITTDLSFLVTKLEQNRTDGPNNFQNICDEAASVATEILKKLGKVNGNDGKYRKLKSVRAAIEQGWSGKELAVLEERLDQMREAIKTTILISLRSAYLHSRFEKDVLILLVRGLM